MSLIYNATFDKNTRKLSFEDKAGNDIYSFTVPERGPAVDDITKPLTLKATQDGSTVKLKKIQYPYGAFQTSMDGGNTWADYTLGTAITLNTSDEVSFRAKDNRTADQNYVSYFQFEMTGKIEAWHNVMSLYRTNDFSTYESVVEYAFAYLFQGCASLTKAPVLPATALATKCYSYMFGRCSLTKAPELPATTLANYCYNGIFYNCSSLTEAPVLPATTLAPYCCDSMFSGCQSLTKAPELPATTLAGNCYSNMFSGCQSLTKAPELPATTLSSNCYQGMFSGCQSLNEVRIAATTTAEKALYNWLKDVSATGDFYCDSNATIFPYGVSGIPKNWRRLNINEVDPTVDDITKPLTFRATQDGSTVKLNKYWNPDGDFQTSRDGGNTWSDYTIGTAITLNTGDEVSFRAKADRASAQTIENYFLFDMKGKIEAWHNVMSLYRTNDFATYESVVEYGFSRLFEGCTSLTKAPVLPATTLADSCYYRMFIGCQSLTKAPELPSTTLATDCYYEMFSGCQSLKEVRVSATKTASRALTYWLSGVSATGDFYCDPNATIFPTGKSGIPENWTRHNIADYPN